MYSKTKVDNQKNQSNSQEHQGNQASTKKNNLFLLMTLAVIVLHDNGNIGKNKNLYPYASQL